MLGWIMIGGWVLGAIAYPIAKGMGFKGLSKDPEEEGMFAFMTIWLWPISLCLVLGYNCFKGLEWVGKKIKQRSERPDLEKLLDEIEDGLNQLQTQPTKIGSDVAVSNLQQNRQGRESVSN